MSMRFQSIGTAALLVGAGLTMAGAMGCQDEEAREAAFLEEIQAEATRLASTRPAAQQEEGGPEPGGAAMRLQPVERAGKRWQQPPAMQIDPEKDYTATIRTNHGAITVDLFEEDTPVTVNNFVFLATEDFYDGVIFHRVIDNFMIQGGDPTGSGMGGPGYQFQDETRGNPHSHEPFTLSMANAGPDTNGSQFFITESAVPQLDPKHTVFGRVTEGREVVTEIASVRTGAQDRPLEDVVIEDVVIRADGEALNPSTQSATQPVE